MDLLVYYWGRTPVVFLAKPGADGLTADAYTPAELVPNAGGTTYSGPQWNSNAVALDDFDGDGHVDVYLGDYFPDGPVLDDRKSGGVAMNKSLSNATNGGEDHVFRWTGASASTVSFMEARGVLPKPVSKGWVLAAGANDLDGDQLPELYIAQDHGKDALLYNRSRPGKIEFSLVHGCAPRSAEVEAARLRLLQGHGHRLRRLRPRRPLRHVRQRHHHDVRHPGEQPPVHQHREEQDRAAFGPARRQGTVGGPQRRPRDGLVGLGLGREDRRLRQQRPDGDRADHRLRQGEVNRWPQLQELAASNDAVVSDPYWWPHVRAGDDVAGSQRLHFFVKDGDRYQDVAKELGLAVPVPTRGIAVGDSDGDGLLDMAVARQWDEPTFYHNTSPSKGSYLHLKLTHDTPAAPAGGGLAAPGSPVVGAQVTVKTTDGRVLLGRVDGGSGHSGKRSDEVHIGLGTGVTGPVQAHLRWRDRTGTVREQDLRLSRPSFADARHSGEGEVTDMSNGTSPTIGKPIPARHNPTIIKALRNFAISISVFNIFGYTVLGFEQPWSWPFVALFTAYAFEMVLEAVSARVEARAPRFTGNGVRGVVEFLYPHTSPRWR